MRGLIEAGKPPSNGPHRLPRKPPAPGPGPELDRVPSGPRSRDDRDARPAHVPNCTPFGRAKESIAGKNRGVPLVVARTRWY